MSFGKWLLQSFSLELADVAPTHITRCGCMAVHSNCQTGAVPALEEHYTGTVLLLFMICVEVAAGDPNLTVLSSA